MRAYFSLFLLIISIGYSNLVNAGSLPQYSRLINIGERNIHIREMGERSNTPSIILLSGPNHHWHSDSAWFALLQPMLAKSYHTLAIDRAGNAWSTPHPISSYQQFSKDLSQVIQQLELDDIILVNFASSNLTSLFLSEQLPQLNVSAMLWIDPDILLPHSIALYSDFPASWYRKNLAKVLPHIAENNWTAKTIKRNNDQVLKIEKLIAKNDQQDMDWHYFKQVQKQRLNINNQQTVAREIALYQDDLALAAKITLPTNIPISIIDSDFELNNIKPGQENYDKLKQWQIEGTQWSKAITQQTQGHYYPLKNSAHLVTFEQPGIIILAIKQLITSL